MNKKISTILILIAILGFVTILYSNHFENAFHFDDSHVIVSNPYIKDLSKAPQFFKDASTFSSLPQNQTYRPLLTLLFSVDYQLSKGLNPRWFHIDSFLWFLLTLISIFLVTKQLFLKSNFSKNLIFASPFIAAAWFGFHTANAETVNYISARSDLFSGFAVVSSLMLWIYLPTVRKFGFFLIPFIAGIFAKEQTVMFLPIFLAYLWLFEEKKSFSELLSVKNRSALKNVLAKSWVLILLSIIGGILVVKMASHTFTPGGTNRGMYMLTQTWVLCRYFIAFFIPSNLSADSDWILINNPFDERIIIGSLVLISMVILIFKWSKSEKYRPISFGLAWFLFALMPTSVVPLAEVTNDHRMFFPFIGLAIAFVWGIALLANKIHKNKIGKTILFLSLFCLLAANGVGVVQRNKVWKSDESLWLDVTQKSPGNGRGWMNYGLTQMQKGNLDSAYHCYNQALVRAPQYPTLHINMGICLNAMSNPTAAETSFKNAILYGSVLYEPYYYYADFLYKHNRTLEAKENIEKSLKLNGWYMNGRYLAMNIYNDLGNWSLLEATADETLLNFPTDSIAANFKVASQKRESKVDAFKRVALANPTPEIYLTLSLESYNAGDFNGCIDACNKALKLKPDYAEAYNNICSAYNALKQYDKAIEAGEKALKINPNYQLAKNNLNFAKSNLK